MPNIDKLDRGQSQQRDGLTHQAIEDYVKTIYSLALEESPVSTSRIAIARSVKPASATSMIQRLARLHLVNYEKHYGVTLTESGEKLALEVIRHHRLLELYLMEALGFEWHEVHEQADILEHVISEKLEERIAAVLNHPEFDPHGDPIPALDGTMAVIDTTALSDLIVGEQARVARVPDDSNSELLRYLAGLELVPGAMVTIIEVAPFLGPLTIEVGDSQKIIGRNLADLVLVQRM
ncbi:MAG TPA: metal-dependent transcriptional regulator [Promineifilum sp.]|nr:metal-dependent transcriptional regulator [Promineifilum sp.]HRO91662.1 metal-dependent transcriptional regulator [Promineifilum sp.]HRQ15021.1 metal-dependent transcriptional regulator [Promineifilum sp.]